MDNVRSLEARLRAVEARFDEVNEKLAALTTSFNAEDNKKLSKERAQLEPIVTAYEQRKAAAAELEEAEAMTRDSEQAIAEMARSEVTRLRPKIAELDARLRALLVPKDPNDDKDIFIEIRAGAGGDEAGLFAGDLLRMYLKYAEAQHLKTELISASENEAGGYKEAVIAVRGNGAYRRFKHESGVHRVQRVPATEASGRVHTSTATVAVLPEADDVEIEINPSDLQIDTYRAQGAG